MLVDWAAPVAVSEMFCPAAIVAPAPTYASTVGETVTLDCEAPTPIRPPVTPLVSASPSGEPEALIVRLPDTRTVAPPRT